MAYESTEVTVSRSQEQIRTVLVKAGADRIMFGEQITGAVPTAGVEFLQGGLLVRVFCPLKRPTEVEISDKQSRNRSGKGRADIERALLEQEGKRIWRVLHWSLKARMEAVAEGLETFEQAFLPHLVNPANNRTVWQTLQDDIEGGALKHVDGAGFSSPLALGAG